MLNAITKTDIIRSWQVKTTLQAVNQGEFMFHSKNGNTDIICSANLSIYDLLREKKDQNYISEDEAKLEPTISNVFTTLHVAVAIKDKIDTIPTTGYWAP